MSSLDVLREHPGHLEHVKPARLASADTVIGFRQRIAFSTHELCKDQPSHGARDFNACCISADLATGNTFLSVASGEMMRPALSLFFLM